jgi:hypothetical protein
MPAAAQEVAQTIVAWTRKLGPAEALRSLALVHRVLTLALGRSYAAAVRDSVEANPDFAGRAQPGD